MTKESEEHVKNNVTNFLYETYYQGKNQINTKGRIDLAIYEDKKPVVIIEAKRPSSPDMVSVKNLNAKAVHELVLYYLRERIDEGNTDVKFLIATNMYEWFVFDASVFDKLFYQNTALTKEYVDWKDGRKPDSTTDFFYSTIASKFLKELKEEIEFTWFDLREIEKVVSNDDPKDDNKLIPIFKLLSPAHLLKQPFANDSNSLDTKFYSELLHIIGLEEKKDGGKKLIQRKEKPDEGSLLENAINNLIAEDHIQNLPRGGADFGETKDERLFNVALELCITWINRILFLKLLEGQLQNYHGGDTRYRFLDFKTIPTYDELNKLFFQVLAREHKERTGTTLEKFKLVPYLNSSLFEPNQLEHETLRINNLDDGLKLKLSGSTVLKNNSKKREGELPTLQYLFEFLNSYDFTSEGKEEIQEENKGLINASVLGLIFEKINGYKDGSFFTPGFITMYMCRETIRRAVVQKFKEVKSWEIDTFDALHNHITPKDIKEANEIINSLKICDPAVGSGHFLVSALNEIIAIKSELGILADQSGKVLRGYTVEVINDELIVSIDHNEFFEYRPGNKDSQRVQEALFYEKQTIIENCLFGVDINPNSVKICRLRLWIELLKNAYYTVESKYMELETLPNIDINIKQGNSLISRFPLDADLSKALKSIKYSINDYRAFVNNYKNATDKDEKRGFEKLIDQIKGDFRSEIGKSDPKLDKKK
jgi:adenine-specific DNA-methyltransferase